MDVTQAQQLPLACSDAVQSRGNIVSSGKKKPDTRPGFVTVC
jgi:hypothetical protein